MEVKIYGNISQEVTINPIDVINRLHQIATGYNGWIIEEDGTYYTVTEMGRSHEERTVISKEKYDYIRSLELVRNTLSYNEQ